MLYLLKKDNDNLGERIKAMLDELCVRYKLRSTEESASYLKDNDQKIEGEKTIYKFLASLRKNLEWERAISADACYIDPETGELC